AATSRSGAALDSALDEIGWADALALAQRPAIAALFEAQGAAGGTSGALGRVLVAGLGLPDDHRAAVILPSFGSASPPATRTDGTSEVRIRGLAAAGLGEAGSALLLARAP